MPASDHVTVRPARAGFFEALVKLGPAGSFCLSGFETEEDARHRGTIVRDAFDLGVAVGEGRIAEDPEPAQQGP